MLDLLLLPELGKLHDALRQEEAKLPPEIRRTWHMELVKQCEEILTYSYVARNQKLILQEE